jgi:Peptidase family S58
MTTVAGSARARARDLGVAPGRLPPGPANAITDVPGIRVGHATVIEPADTEHGELRTGVTAIVHDALIGRDPGRSTLPAGLAVYNGFGKMVGATQIEELGTVETPVLLTSTLSVFRVADALLSYLRERPAFAQSPSLNPVVAETNDGYLSDIWARRVTAAHVAAALDSAAAGPVAEGCVGAGTGEGAGLQGRHRHIVPPAAGRGRRASHGRRARPNQLHRAAHRGGPASPAAAARAAGDRELVRDRAGYRRRPGLAQAAPAGPPRLRRHGQDRLGLLRPQRRLRACAQRRGRRQGRVGRTRRSRR